MREYVRRVSKKVSKLSDEQVEEFLTVIGDENDMLDSILESLSTGLLIVDESSKPLMTNKAAERYLPFSIRPDDPKFENTPLWQLIDDSEIASFLKDVCEKDRTNVSNEFSTATAGGSVRFIIVSVLPLVQQQ